MFAVSCMSDSDNPVRVDATSKRFDTEKEAEDYAATVDASRDPEVHRCCSMCEGIHPKGGEWRTFPDEGGSGYDRCGYCGCL